MSAAWLSGRSVVDILVLIAAAVGALVLIGKAVFNTVRFFERLEKALKNVEQQLYPNGGASLRDAVNRIQERLDIEDIATDEHVGG